MTGHMNLIQLAVLPPPVSVCQSLACVATAQAAPFLRHSTYHKRFATITSQPLGKWNPRFVQIARYAFRALPTSTIQILVDIEYQVCEALIGIGDGEERGPRVGYKLSGPGPVVAREEDGVGVCGGDSADRGHGALESFCPQGDVH